MYQGELGEAAYQPFDSLSDSSHWYHCWEDLLLDAVTPESMNCGGLYLGCAVQKDLFKGDGVQIKLCARQADALGLCGLYYWEM